MERPLSRGSRGFIRQFSRANVADFDAQDGLLTKDVHFELHLNLKKIYQIKTNRLIVCVFK